MRARLGIANDTVMTDHLDQIPLHQWFCHVTLHARVETSLPGRFLNISRDCYNRQSRHGSLNFGSVLLFQCSDLLGCLNTIAYGC